MKAIAEANLDLIGVRYNLFVRNKKKGTGFKKVASGKNLILDNGLDLLGNSKSANMTRYCAVGTGTAPTNRDSSTTTASQSGTTVTASAGFFEAADVGRLLKFDSGEEHYITTFNSSTEVIVATSATVASSEFTIWYVDDTVLDTESTRTGTCRTDSGDNESTLSAGIVNHKRTHLFPAVGSGVTYQEIGWSSNSGGGASLFNRSLIPGGVVLVSGDELLVESNFELEGGPQTSTAQSDVGSGGFDTSGTVQCEGTGISTVTSSGATSSFGGIDGSDDTLEPNPGSGDSIKCGTATTAFNTYGTPSSSNSLGLLASSSYSNGSYSNGNFYRDKTGTFSTSSFNSSNINWISMGRSDGGNEIGFRLRLTSAQEKLGTETLVVVLRVSWARTLTN